MKMWQCGSCGYIHEGDGPPEQCPKCGAGRERFAEISSAAVEGIKRARFTNSLHMHLFSLLEDARDIADAGVQEELDSACVKIFEETEEFATQMQRKINAELETHVQGGKWG